MTLLIPRPIEKICGIESAWSYFISTSGQDWELRLRHQTYHRGNDGIVIFVQLATSGQSRSQAGGNEADGDKGEDDGNDSKIDTTAMELIVSHMYDGHVASCVEGTRVLRGEVDARRRKGGKA